MTDHLGINGLANEVLQLAERFAAFVERLSVEAFHRRADDEAWTAAEITGHAAEFPLLFTSAAATVARQPGFRFGRELDDPGRLAAVARLGSASPAEGAEAIRRAAADAAATIRDIDPGAEHSTGVRLNGDIVTVRWIIEELVRDHLALHFRQARQAAGG